MVSLEAALLAVDCRAGSRGRKAILTLFLACLVYLICTVVARCCNGCCFSSRSLLQFCRDPGLVQSCMHHGCVLINSCTCQ